MIRTVVTAAAVTLGVSALAADRAPVAVGVDDLAWLAGHWRSELESATVEEGWLGPAGGTMIGVNRTVTGGRTAAFEFLRLEDRNGGIVYLASPGGRCPATPFELVALDHHEAVFENTDHDFPQRVIYRRDRDRLIAAIEGVEKGKNRRVEWVYEQMP